MDPPASSLPKPSSTIPRPMSKLPMLRPSVTATTTSIGRPPSPDRRPYIPPPTPPLQSSHRQSLFIASRPSSIAPPPQRQATSPQRRPLHPSSRPQSRHDSATSSFPSDRYDAQARVKTQRHPSQQENSLDLLASPAGSEASSEAAESIDASPTSTLRRAPRPSLSDRALESISNVPPSPGVNRRRSSFFNPQSPMSHPVRQSSRPPSALGQSAVPKLDFNAARINGFVRPPSPTKRPGSSGIMPSPARPAMATPQRRSVSSALAKPVGAPSAIAIPNKRASVIPSPAQKPSASSTPRTVARPPSASHIANARQRPMSRMGPPPGAADTGRPHAASKATSSAIKPTRPTSGAPKAIANTDEEISVPVEKPTKSSSDFRAQVAKARAAARAGIAKKPTETVNYNFEDVEDPFNQGPSGGSTLDKRIDSARRDGRLNIAALGLNSIPPEVMRMYDSEAMEASSLTWSETVDLVRFSAADNEIVQISDEVFPDASVEELASGFEAKGNQFGGLEVLDLHCNSLKAVPMGLRRLTMLTSLNLSRNKLDNSIFSLITQITSLRELNLADNDLTRDVPESISALTTLESLNLSNNKLTSLPGCVRDLVNLRLINVSSNRFDALPIGSLFSLPSLKEVYAASNALTGAFFPMTVDIVRSLTHLDLSNNSLASISFGAELHLPAIQVLNVSRNRLFALPNVSSWQNLLTLLAEENGLTALPDGFAALGRKLRTADFARNSLRAVEPEVGRMDALEMLGLAANPLRDKKLLTMSTAQVKEEMLKKLASRAEGAGAGASE